MHHPDHRTLGENDRGTRSEPNSSKVDQRFEPTIWMSSLQLNLCGPAISAGISSFITWSGCSGHRSLNDIRTLAAYTGTHKDNIPNRRLLGRTATIIGSSSIPRVRFSIHAFLRLPPLTLKPTYWQLATFSCFNTHVGAQRSVSSFGCKKGSAEINKIYFSVPSWFLSWSRADGSRRTSQPARKLHPDTNPDKNTRENFQEMQEAYEVRVTTYCQSFLTSQQPGFDPDAFGREPLRWWICRIRGGRC